MEDGSKTLTMLGSFPALPWSCKNNSNNGGADWILKIPNEIQAQIDMKIRLHKAEIKGLRELQAKETKKSMERFKKHAHRFNHEIPARLDEIFKKRKARYDQDERCDSGAGQVSQNQSRPNCGRNEDGTKPISKRGSSSNNGRKFGGKGTIQDASDVGGSSQKQNPSPSHEPSAPKSKKPRKPKPVIVESKDRPYPIAFAKKPQKSALYKSTGRERSPAPRKNSSTKPAGRRIFNSPKRNDERKRSRSQHQSSQRGSSPRRHRSRSPRKSSENPLRRNRRSRSRSPSHQITRNPLKEHNSNRSSSKSNYGRSERSRSPEKHQKSQQAVKSAENPLRSTKAAVQSSSNQCTIDEHYNGHFVYFVDGKRCYNLSDDYKMDLLDEKAQDLDSACYEKPPKRKSYAAYYCDNRCSKIVYLQKLVCEEIRKIRLRNSGMQNQAQRRSVHERVGDHDQVAWTNNLSDIKPKESSEEKFARESGIWKPGKSSK